MSAEASSAENLALVLPPFPHPLPPSVLLLYVRFPSCQHQPPGEGSLGRKALVVEQDALQMADFTGLDMASAREALEVAGNDVQRAVTTFLDEDPSPAASSASPSLPAAAGAEAGAKDGANTGGRCARCNQVLGQRGRFCIERGIPTPGEA